MVTDGSYAYGEHSIMYTVQSLCCTPETNVTLGVNYTQILERGVGEKRQEASPSVILRRGNSHQSDIPFVQQNCKASTTSCCFFLILLKTESKIIVHEQNREFTIFGEFNEFR